MVRTFKNETIGDEITLADLASASKSDYFTNEQQNNLSKLRSYGKGEVNVYKLKDTDNYIISHRGTDFSKRTSILNDLKADFNIIVGNGNIDSKSKRRMYFTEKAINKLKNENENSNIYLSGHSLGGFTSTYAMAKSPLVRENIKEHHTFNPLAPPGGALISSIHSSNTTHHHVR
jgi:hypothetical protein